MNTIIMSIDVINYEGDETHFRTTYGATQGRVKNLVKEKVGNQKYRMDNFKHCIVSC